MKRILYAETVREDQEALQGIISSGDLYYGLTVVDSTEEVRKALQEDGIDLVLLSVCLDEPETYTIIEDFEEIPFVILPGEGNERIAVQAFRAGAADYLVKDEQGEYLSQLPKVVERAIQKKKAAQERKSYQEELEKIVSERAQVLLEANQRLTQETQQRVEIMGALQESEIRYSLIFNRASDAILIHDFNGQILDINDKVCEDLGYTRSELLEMTAGEIDESVEGPIDPQMIEELRDQGHLVLESIYRRKDGSRYPVETSSRIIDYKGKKAVVVIARNISERKKAERALSDREEIYYSFFQTSPDAMFMATQDGHWVDMNQAAVELFGYETKEEMMGVHFRDLYLHPENHDEYLEKIKEEAHTKDYPLTLRRKDGREFPALISSTHYKVDGKVRGFQGTILDLSREHELEAERQEAVKQQEVIDALSQDLRSTLDLEEIYESLVSHLGKIIDMDYFLLFRVKEEQDLIDVKFVWGVGQSLDTAYYSGISSFAKQEGSALREVVQSGKTVYTPNLAERLHQDQAHYAFGEHGEMLKGGEVGDAEDFTRSALLVPLIVDEEETGILEIHSHQEDAFSASDVNLCERVANLIAMGLQKSYLLEESEKHIERLNALHKIDQAINESQSLPTMLDTLRDQLVNVLKVDAADILYLHPELNSLKIITQTGFQTNPLKYTDLDLGEGPAGEAASSRSTVYISDIIREGVEFARSPDFDQEGFVTYIGVPLIAKGDLVGVLEIFHRSKLDADPDWIDFLEALAGQAAIAIAQRNLYKNLKRSKEQLNEAYDALIESWAQAMELRDIETKGHAQRLVDLTLQLAQEMGVEEAKWDDIRRGAYLHDVGKMGIPDRILKKKGKLTKEEREEIGQHPLYAYEMLKSIDHLRPALDIPLYHHERWDGLGYPDGLKGEEIPLAARIFAVVDVWDALRSGRPYREAWSDQKALEHIKEESGRHFDPRVVDAFLRIIEI